MLYATTARQMKTSGFKEGQFFSRGFVTVDGSSAREVEKASHFTPHGAYSFFSIQLAGDLLIAKESLFLNYNQKNNIKWMKKMTGGWLCHLYFLLLE
jgi:hypothetical protein